MIELKSEVSHLLILCTGNSCRSQMAEGFLRKMLPEHIKVSSAGVETHGLNPRAVASMAAIGIDIGSQKSQLVDDFIGEGVDLLLTVCDHARESCPTFPEQVQQIHHSFPDPAKASGEEAVIMGAFAKTRDEIQTYCEKLSAAIRNRS